MTNDSYKPELLAPAGSLDKLKVAILYGADAVYLSGQKYGLRASADNFTEAEIELAVAFAHSHSAKVYVAVNAFLYDEDLPGLDRFCKFLEATGVDALIASDLGVIAVIKRNCRLPIHLSTQASCLNVASARLWKNIGISRVIVGREISLVEAAKMRQLTGLDVELFVHGAMCMSYAGHCVISNYTAGRDANRGGCNQSCRFKYSLISQTENDSSTEFSGYYMSSKDLNGLHLIPQIFDNRITSLKIEGRMKSMLYVATVTSVYRQAIDAYSSAGWTEALVSKLNQELKSMPHRDYTDGALQKPAGADSVYLENTPPAENATHQMLGWVLDQKDRLSHVHLFQPLKVNQEIELLTFTGEVLPVKIKRLVNGASLQVNKSRQATVVALELPSSAKKYSVLRTRVSGEPHVH